MLPDSSLVIIYQDDALLVVNKPSGIPVIPDGYDRQRPNLHALLSASHGRLWVVHRLDQETSGVILFARSAPAHRQLNQQFENHAVQKNYHLLTFGPINWDTRVVDLPLRIDGDRKHRTIHDPKDGKPARTAFTVVERFNGGICLLSAAPGTGYTHQIRAHCASLGLWLINDPLYFPFPYPRPADFQPLHRSDLFPLVQHLPISRLALHACEITIQHPESHTPLILHASYPWDFSQTLKLLRFH